MSTSSTPAPVSRMVEHGGRQIAVEELDPGGPARGTVVLVPGLGSGRRLFGTLPRRFAKAGLRCITFDPIGVPPSSEFELGAEFSFDEAAEDLLAVLPQPTATPAPLHLVGTSLGGKVALRAAAAAASRIASLTLLASSAVPSARGHAIYAFFEQVVRHVPAAAFGTVIAPFLIGRSFHEARPQVVADIMRAVRPSHSVQRLMLAQARALQSYDGQDDAARWTGPTLLISGAEDTLTDAADVRRTAALWPHARLIEIDDAGHSLLLESAAVLDAVLAFVGGAVSG